MDDTKASWYFSSDENISDDVVLMIALEHSPWRIGYFFFPLPVPSWPQSTLSWPPEGNSSILIKLPEELSFLLMTRPWIVSPSVFLSMQPFLSFYHLYPGGYRCDIYSVFIVVDPHWLSSITIIVCVILATIPLCSVSSSYAPIVDLHDTPKGSLQVKSCSGLDSRLEVDRNHAHDTKWQSESSGYTDTHT